MLLLKQALGKKIAEQFLNGAHYVRSLRAISVSISYYSINYLRYTSFHLEIMSKLTEQFPEIYEQFRKGNLAVKRKPGTFNGAAPDMKLEQTIQRSKQIQSGIIGKTRKNNHVTDWELV